MRCSSIMQQSPARTTAHNSRAGYLQQCSRVPGTPKAIEVNFLRGESHNKKQRPVKWPWPGQRRSRIILLRVFRVRHIGIRTVNFRR